MSNSSKRCGWPILGSIVGRNYDPFVIEIYEGYGKPKSVDAFIAVFVQEFGSVRGRWDCSGRCEDGRRNTIVCHSFARTNLCRVFAIPQP